MYDGRKTSRPSLLQTDKTGNSLGKIRAWRKNPSKSELELKLSRRPRESYPAFARNRRDKCGFACHGRMGLTGCDAADKSFISDYKIAHLFRGFRPAKCCVEIHVSVALVAAQSSRIPRGSQVCAISGQGAALNNTVASHTRSLREKCMRGKNFKVNVVQHFLHAPEMCNFRPLQVFSNV